jgi:hypothetical protein
MQSMEIQPMQQHMQLIQQHALQQMQQQQVHQLMQQQQMHPMQMMPQQHHQQQMYQQQDHFQQQQEMQPPPAPSASLVDFRINGVELARLLEKNSRATVEVLQLQAALKLIKEAMVRLLAYCCSH